MQKSFYISKDKQRKLFKTKIYCIDTSSIINLFRHPGLPYPPYREDIFVGLWKKLEEMINNGMLISHITVLKELKRRDDDVKKWCNKYKNIFKDIDDCQVEKIKEVETKYNKEYWEKEINRNQEWADPWIIALAICKEAIIISDEKNSPNHIPYIANDFGIITLNLMDFFKDIGLILK